MPILENVSLRLDRVWALFQGPKVLASAALLGVLLLLLSCQPKAKTPPPERAAAVRVPGAPEIRVAILKNEPAVTLTAGSGQAQVVGPTGWLSAVPPRGTLQLTASAGGIRLNANRVVSGTLRVDGGSEYVQVNGQSFARRILISPAGQGLLVVAQLDLEEYLLGVLSGEVPYRRWSPEALKAQAIASRTFALYQMKLKSAAPYDVESTVMSQVFHPGAQSEPLLLAAASATRGLALTEGGEVFCAYFHSTCGGQTAPSSSVFPEQSAGPLRGVRCAYCSASPSFRWKCELNKETLRGKLQTVAAGHSLERILSLEFLDSAGVPLAAGKLTRATQVRVRHAGGVLSMPGNQFRLAAGAGTLRSLQVEVVTDRADAFEISGLGFGHGVGLCQYGSQGLGLAGKRYPEILGFYYPGAALKKMY